MILDKKKYGLIESAPDTIEQLIDKIQSRISIRSDVDASIINILCDAYKNLQNRYDKLLEEYDELYTSHYRR